MEADKEQSNVHHSPETHVFSEEGLKALQELGEVLLRIRRRLIAEGKEIEIDAHYANRDTGE